MLDNNKKHISSQECTDFAQIGFTLQELLVHCNYRSGVPFRQKNHANRDKLLTIYSCLTKMIAITMIRMLVNYYCSLDPNSFGF